MFVMINDWHALNYFVTFKTVPGDSKVPILPILCAVQQTDLFKSFYITSVARNVLVFY